MISSQKINEMYDQPGEELSESRIGFRTEVKATIDVDDLKSDILSRDNNMIPYIKAKRKRVIVVTPFLNEKIDVKAKLDRYAKLCTIDSLNNSEAPLSSQAMYLNLSGYTGTNIERDASFITQLNWMLKAELVAFYIDYGITPAMESMMNYCTKKNINFEIRMIGEGV